MDPKAHVASPIRVLSFAALDKIIQRNSVLWSQLSDIGTSFESAFKLKKTGASPPHSFQPSSHPAIHPASHQPTYLRKPSMPAAMHSTRSRSEAFAVMATMGTWQPSWRISCR